MHHLEFSDDSSAYKYSIQLNVPALFELLWPNKLTIFPLSAT